MKNKKKPFSQTGAYLPYVTVCENGSAAVIRSIAPFSIRLRSLRDIRS